MRWPDLDPRAHLVAAVVIACVAFGLGLSALALGWVALQAIINIHGELP